MKLDNILRHLVLAAIDVLIVLTTVVALVGVFVMVAP